MSAAAKAALDEAQKHFADPDRRASAQKTADSLNNIGNVVKNRGALNASRTLAKRPSALIRSSFSSVEVVPFRFLISRRGSDRTPMPIKHQSPLDVAVIPEPPVLQRKRFGDRTGIPAVSACQPQARGVLTIHAAEQDGFPIARPHRVLVAIAFVSGYLFRFFFTCEIGNP